MSALRFRSTPLISTSKQSNPIAAENLEREKFYSKNVEISNQIWKSFATGIFAVRLLAAVIVQTFYVPDEYYQSVDVVHNFILNATDVTWEWKYPIRSSFWMFPIILLAQIANFIGLYRFINIQIMTR